MDRLLKACRNCEDYDHKESACTIRFTILPDKSRTPMKRKPSQKGCKVFMYKTNLGESK